MYKNSESLDKINELIYGIGNYINAYDVQKHMNNSLAGQLGVGYDYNTHPIPFAPTVSSGIQYMKPKGYVDKNAEAAEADEGSTYDDIKAGQSNVGAFGGPVYDVGGALNAGAGALKLGTDALNNYASKSQIKGLEGVYQGIGGLANTRFAGSNENLIEQDLATQHYNPGTYRDLMTSNSRFGVGDAFQAIGAGMEGAKAGSGLGPVGIGVGALIGAGSGILSTLLGRHRQKRRAQREIGIVNAAGRAANAAKQENFEDATERNNAEQAWNALLNYGSMDAGLGTSYNSALGGRLFDGGGFMGNHGSVWDTGLNYFKTGGTHEENPNGGILQGYDSQGTPNLVEEGEYKWTDDKYGFGEYIFSNRLEVPQEVARKYKLGGTAKKPVTFAQGIQKYLKDNGVEDMENDPIQQDTTGEFLATMATVQEQVRVQEQIKQFIEELKQMPPEQQRQVLEQLQQQAIQQQQQAMQEQQAMQQVEQQQQAIGQPMEQQEDSQEAPQEVPQEQMVQDTGQPVMEQQGQAQQAYGGRIFATGGNTMMENQGYEAMTDEDKEALQNQEEQQMQEDTTRAQKQEEEAEEERLDDQIDQIIEYAKETYNKELLVGARKAQRGSIEEKKAFIERASQLMETERQQQQQTAAQQDQQQNVEMQARLQQEAQQPQPGEVPQEDMGINTMAYGGRMNTFGDGGSKDKPNKQEERARKQAERMLKKAYGRKGYNELTERQKMQLINHVMNTKEDLTQADKDYYDRMLGRQIVDPTELLANAPKVTMYDALKDDARTPFNESLKGYIKAGDWDNTYWKDQQALTDYYRQKYTEFINNKRNKNYTYTQGKSWDKDDDIDAALEREFLTGTEAREFYNALMGGTPTDKALANLFANMWVDDKGNALDWTDKGTWEFNNSSRNLNGNVVESSLYKNWANTLEGRNKTKKIDALFGIRHDPNGGVTNGREIQYYLNDTDYKDENRLGIDPTNEAYAQYYTVDGEPVKTIGNDGKEIWKYNVIPKSATQYIKVTYDKHGNPIYRMGSEEEMGQEGNVPDTSVPKEYRTVESPDLPGYRINNQFYTPKLGEKGSNGKIMEGIEGMLNGINWREIPQFLYQLAHPANQSYYNMALRQWDRVPMMDTAHLGNYVAPQYVDINSMNNKAMALGLQGIQAAQNISNGNVGALNYNTQLANYMMQQELADNLIKGTQWNAEQQQKAAAHNTEKVDTVNLAQDLTVGKQNQDAMIARAQAYPAVADKMTENEASWHQGVAQGIGRITSSNDQLLSNSEYRKIIDALIKDLGLG